MPPARGRYKERTIHVPLLLPLALSTESSVRPRHSKQLRALFHRALAQESSSAASFARAYTLDIDNDHTGTYGHCTQPISAGRRYRRGGARTHNTVRRPSSHATESCEGEIWTSGFSLGSWTTVAAADRKRLGDISDFCLSHYVEQTYGR